MDEAADDDELEEDDDDLEAVAERLAAAADDPELGRRAAEYFADDPMAYARVLDRAAALSGDSRVASRYLVEAARVSRRLGKAKAAAMRYREAIEREPTNDEAAHEFRDFCVVKGKVRSLLAVLERRAQDLSRELERRPELAAQVARAWTDVARVWCEEPVLDPAQAIEAYGRAMSTGLAPREAFSGARALYVRAGQLDDARLLVERERELTDEPRELSALFAEEAGLAHGQGDLEGAARALRSALTLRGHDEALALALARTLAARVAAGAIVRDDERREAAAIFCAAAARAGAEGASLYVDALSIDASAEAALAALSALPLESLAPIEASFAGLPKAAGARLARSLAEAAVARGELARGARLFEEALALEPSAALAVRLLELYARSDDHVAALSLLRRSSALPVERRVERLVELAQAALADGREADALEAHLGALALVPSHEGSLPFVEQALRRRRDLARLCDVLVSAAEHTHLSAQRRRCLADAARLSELSLGDLERASRLLRALTELAPEDEVPRRELRRIEERLGHWDALASLLDEDARRAAGTPGELTILRKLAELHEVRRGDYVSAARAWERVAKASPAQRSAAVQTALALYEQIDEHASAARLLAEHVRELEPAEARTRAYEKLARLLERGGDRLGAARAVEELALRTSSLTDFERAEALLVRAGRLEDAARVVALARERAKGALDRDLQVRSWSRQAEHLRAAGEHERALEALARAAELVPPSHELGREVERSLEHPGREGALAEHLHRRADACTGHERATLLRRVAKLERGALERPDAAARSYRALLELEPGDEEALEFVAARLSADERSVDGGSADGGSAAEAAALFARLARARQDPSAKRDALLAEARQRARIDDHAGARRAVESALELDADPREALELAVDLAARDADKEAVVRALERLLELSCTSTTTLELSRRLADELEELGELERAIPHAERVHELDPSELSTITRLVRLCEQTARVARAAELLGRAAERASEPAERASFTLRRAELLFSLGEREAALEAAGPLASSGDEAARALVVRVSDALDDRGAIVERMVEWYGPSPRDARRTEALSEAFERALSVGRARDAALAARALHRTAELSREQAERLCALALETAQREAVAFAHEALLELTPPHARAHEQLRQAEQLAERAGLAAVALAHGEGGLLAAAREHVDELLHRLARLAHPGDETKNLYARLFRRALDEGRGDVAAATLTRASDALSDEQLEAHVGLVLARSPTPLETGRELAARLASQGLSPLERRRVARALSPALSRLEPREADGGKLRSASLRLAAKLAKVELGDESQAFEWLGDALFARVEGALAETERRLAVSTSESLTLVASLRELARSLGPRELARDERRAPKPSQGPALRPPPPPPARAAPSRVANKRDDQHPDGGRNTLNPLNKLTPSPHGPRKPTGS